MNRFWRDAGVLALVIAALSLVATIAINLVYEKFGFWSTAGGLLFVVALVFAVSYAVFKCLYATISDRLDALDVTVRGVNAAFGKDWLISRAGLLKIEEKTKAGEVWVISRGLQEETDEETYLRVVRKNIKRGIKYTYIAPDNDVTRAKAEQIKSAHENSTQIDFRFIKEEFFDLVAAQDIAIIGPIGKEADSMKAYMNLPIGPGGSEYFIVLGGEFAEKLVGRLLGLGIGGTGGIAALQPAPQPAAETRQEGPSTKA